MPSSWAVSHLFIDIRLQVSKFALSEQTLKIPLRGLHREANRALSPRLSRNISSQSIDFIATVFVQLTFHVSLRDRRVWIF